MEIKTNLITIFKNMTHSERYILKVIADELEGNQDGDIVISQLASTHKLNRSQITFVLRLLKVTGITDNYSMGRRGEHIKVINAEAFNELTKISQATGI